MKALRRFFMPVIIALWRSFLFLPFRGIKAAAVLFLVLTATVPLLKFISGLIGKIHVPLEAAKLLLPKDRRYLPLLLIPVLLVPFLAEDYIIDVAIISGIYIILALGLNVVVGFTGLLNLGFVAFYAVCAYS